VSVSTAQESHGQQVEKRFEVAREKIVVERNEHGIPEISAGSYRTRCEGWVDPRPGSTAPDAAHRILLQAERPSCWRPSGADPRRSLHAQMKFEVDAAAEVLHSSPGRPGRAYPTENQGQRGTVFGQALGVVRAWRPVDSMVLAQVMGSSGWPRPGNMRTRPAGDRAWRGRLKELFPI